MSSANNCAEIQFKLLNERVLSTGGEPCTGFLEQYLQNSYSLGKIQNLGDPDRSEEKI